MLGCEIKFATAQLGVNRNFKGERDFIFIFIFIFILVNYFYIHDIKFVIYGFGFVGFMFLG